MTLQRGQIDGIGEVRGEYLVALDFEARPVRGEVRELPIAPSAALVVRRVDVGGELAIVGFTDRDIRVGVLNQAFRDLDRNSPENFKARFERALADALPPDRFQELVHKIDGAWTDVLWPYHDDDQIVDDEFLRYLDFIIEVCEWRQGVTSEGRLLDRAERIFSAGDEVNVAFLFHAFDTWTNPESRCPVDIGEVFGRHLVSASNPGELLGNQVLLFDSANPNLFQECCRRYGEKRGRARQFTLSETLFLFAILIHRQYGTEDIQARLRVLRNLTDRADDEVREERMPDLLNATERLIRTGALDDLRGFNQDRVMDEVEKRKYLADHPDQEAVLHRLEDHPLLRGRVFAFDLEPSSLAARADAFDQITPKAMWPRLTAALLSDEADYGLPLGQRGYQYGSSEQESRWRDVFTRRGRGRNAIFVPY